MKHVSFISIFILLLIAGLIVEPFETIYAITGKIWKQLPLRTQAQLNADMNGGEGMQLVMSMSYAPSDENIVYLVTNTSQVWKSADGGYSWAMKNNGFNAMGGISLAVDSHNPDVVFVAGSRCNSNSSQVDGIYRTQDGGDHWELVRPTKYYGLFEEKGGVNFAFKNSSTIYAGTHEEGLLKSDNNGNPGTWIQVLGYEELGNSKILDVKIHPIDSSLIFLATTSGLYKVRDGQEIVLTKLGNMVVGMDNMLVNSGFETGDFYGWNRTDSAYALFYVDTEKPGTDSDYSAKIEVTGGGSPWAVRLYQVLNNYFLEKGEDYKVAFWAKGSGFTENDGIAIRLTDPVFGWLVAEKKLTVTSEWQQYEIKLHNILSDSANPSLIFLLGHLPGRTLWIDEINFAHVDVLDNGLPAEQGNFPRAIVIHPQQPDIIYVTAGTSGVYRTNNGGLSFAPVNEGLVGSGAPLNYDKKAIHLAMSPANPDHLYVSFYEWWDLSPYYSRDGGQTWNKPMTLDSENIYIDLYDSMVPFFGSAIAPHPNDTNTALATAGSCHPVKTVDGGVNYRYSSNGYTGGVVSWSSTSFGFDPYDPNKMVFFHTDFGAYLTLDAGSTYKRISNDSVYDAMPGAVDFREGDEMIVATVRPVNKPNPIHVIAVTRKRGESWQLFDGTNGTIDTSGEFRYVAFHPDPLKKNIIYAGQWRSEDRGFTWTKLPMSIRLVYPANGDIVYAIREDIPWKSTKVCKSVDRGDNWNCDYFGVLNAVFNDIYESEIAVDPVDEDRIYVAARNALYIWDKITWLVITDSDGFERNALDQLSIARVAVDPNNPNTVYAASWSWGAKSNGVFRSNDRGLSFEKINDIGTSWGALAVNPWNSVLYMGSPYGTHILCTDADGDTYATEGGPCGPVDINDNNVLIYRLEDLTAKVQKSKIKLQWTCAPEAGAYNVYRMTTQSGTYELIAENYLTDGCNFFESATIHGATYSYIIRWVNPDGYESADSNEASITY